MESSRNSCPDRKEYYNLLSLAILMCMNSQNMSRPEITDITEIAGIWSVS